ncbi:MAG: cyclase family protein [Myxococcales bacterium]|nr:cyclase family protein [Myxococcales bacterium]
MHAVRFDWSKPVDIAIPVCFSQPQTRAWGIAPATQQPWRDGSFVGEITEGGSVNCREMRIVAHSAGTHTECVGHVVADPVTMADVILRPVSLAALITVPLHPLGASGDTYGGTSLADDAVISARSLQHALRAIGNPPSSEFATGALVLRTQLDGVTRVGHDWSNSNPPYLTDQAIDVLRDAGFMDLLLDIPSVDREWDGGDLPSHHRWWDLPAGVRRLQGTTCNRTITELIDVPTTVADGWYGLLLQVPSIASDAVPSRPVLYPLLASANDGDTHA